MLEIMPRSKSEQEINQMSPLIWAYAGDCIYELYIRTHLVNTTNLKPHMLHINTIKYVKAGAQAEILKKILDFLTDDEKEIVRRGRNSENHHLPKNASLEEYMYATALEGLLGYLYLTKNDKRLQEILEEILKIID